MLGFFPPARLILYPVVSIKTGAPWDRQSHNSTADSASQHHQMELEGRHPVWRTPSGSLYMDDPPLDARYDSLSPVGDLQFGENVGEMHFDRSFN